VKSTLTVLIGSTMLFAGTALACPYSDKSQEMTYLEPHQKQQNMVEHERKIDDNLLVELKKESQDTATN